MRLLEIYIISWMLLIIVFPFCVGMPFTSGKGYFKVCNEQNLFMMYVLTSQSCSSQLCRNES